MAQSRRTTRSATRTTAKPARTRRTAAKSASRTAPTRAPGGTALAAKRSVARVLLLSIVSFGLYQLYWFYVTRKQLDQELGEERSIKMGPGVQLALVILLSLIFIGVILGVVFAYLLLKDISRAREKQGLSGIPAALYLLAPIVAGLVLFFLPGAGAIVGLVTFGLAVSKLNEYWDKKTNGRATDAKVSAAEVLVTLAGLVLIVLMLALGVAAAVFGVDKAKDGNYEDLNQKIEKLQEKSSETIESY